MYVKDTVLSHTMYCENVVNISQVMISHDMSLFVRSTLCVTPLVWVMRVVATADLPNTWTSWLWIRQNSDPLLSESPFLCVPKRFVFSSFFSVCTRWLLKYCSSQRQVIRRKTGEKWSFEYFPRTTKISFWTVVLLKIMQFHGHIIDGYREIQETGVNTLSFDSFFVWFIVIQNLYDPSY